MTWSSAPGQTRVSPAEGPAGGLTVLSLNLAMREDIDRIATEIAAIGADMADVLLLQEVVERPGQVGVAHRLGDRLGRTAVFAKAFDLDDGRSVGLATLSAFPATDVRVIALKRFNLAFRSRDRIALAATLATPSGPVRTYNVHLDTRLNTGDRLDQIGGIVADVQATPGHAIVAGDFNTNGYRWLFRAIPVPFAARQGRGLERFMAANGFRSAFNGGPTHDALRMRLDWVFLRGLEPSAAAIHPLDLSDHHALVVEVVMGVR